MARRVTLYVTLFSWLIATGTQWDVMQVVAWARMVVVYSQNMTVAAAVQLTFSPEGKCDLCRFVEEGRSEESQRAAAAGTSEKREVKALLAGPAGDEGRVEGAGDAGKWTDDAAWCSRARGSPPLPPPRVSQPA